MARVDVQITEQIAWLLSKPKRIKIAVGGRGSAKTIGFADIVLMKTDKGARVCCTREFQNTIEDSVHETLKPIEWQDGEIEWYANRITEGPTGRLLIGSNCLNKFHRLHPHLDHLSNGIVKHEIITALWAQGCF